MGMRNGRDSPRITWQVAELDGKQVVSSPHGSAFSQPPGLQGAAAGHARSLTALVLLSPASQV
jgi:hypothetical protein